MWPRVSYLQQHQHTQAAGNNIWPHTRSPAIMVLFVAMVPLPASHAVCQRSRHKTGVGRLNSSIPPAIISGGIDMLKRGEGHSKAHYSNPGFPKLHHAIPAKTVHTLWKLAFSLPSVQYCSASPMLTTMVPAHHQSMEHSPGIYVQDGP